MKHCINNGIGLVTIDSPPVNALCAAVMDGLETAFAALRADTTLRCLVVTGAGPKAFVAGADLTELAEWTPGQAEAGTARGQRLFGRIEAFPVPVIAAVNGFALGGGLELALACDIRLAAENARFGLPETTLGLIPGYGGTQRLWRLVGLGRAKQMIFSGQAVTAQEALAMGLVEAVCPPEALQEQAMALAKRIAGNGPQAVRAAKRAMDCWRQGTIHTGLAAELAEQTRLFTTGDHTEGIAAFLEKRAADFQNG